MNQAELKVKAISILNLSDQQITLEAQQNCILAAQVYATLATIPDAEPYDDFGL